MLPAHSFTFQITIKPDDLKVQDDLRERLKGIFNISDAQPHALIAEDRNDANKKQYQLIGMPSRLIADTSQGAGYVTFLVTIAVMEPVWQAVTPSTSNWAITATGQTKIINTPGNVLARPILAITPTTPRTAGQFAYRRFTSWFNRAGVPMSNYPIAMTVSTTALVNNTAVSNQINQGGGITAVTLSIPIDTPVGGGLPTGGGMCYVDTEQMIYSGIAANVMTVTTRGAGGTTAATHADNAVISQSKMLANGTDLAVQIDGALTNVWIDSPNTATTKIWFNSSWQIGQAGTLLVALPNNSTTVTVFFTKNTTNLNMLKALKQARNSVFIIGAEVFTFLPGNVNLVTYSIASCLRGQKGLNFSSHAIGDAITWLEHDIWLLYGNTAGSPLVTDDSQKPLLDLTNSTNTSWVQTQFYDTSSVRPAAWTPTVLSSTGKQSSIFYGNQKAAANPATELGLDLLNYQIANIWKAETASLVWSMYHPAGITTVSMAGSKYVFSLGTFPAVAGLQKSLNGVTWLTVWNEAIPGAANTWTAFTHNTVALSATYRNIRLALIGTISALPNNEAAIQGDTVTLALDNTKTPGGGVGSEQSPYYLNATITNTLTGDYITLSYAMDINKTLTIDTVAKTVTYFDNSNAISALTLSSTRNDWLPLSPNNGESIGVDNTLKYDDTGVANVSIVVTWSDRNL